MNLYFIFLLLLIIFPRTIATSKQIEKDKTKEATQSQTESNEYKAIEDKIRKIVADYLQVEVDKIKVDTPITGDRVSTREVEIVEIMMKVEKEFSIDFSKEYGDKAVSDLAEKLTVKQLSKTVYDNSKKKKKKFDK